MGNDDGDGTLRVSPVERKQARQRLDDAIGVDKTISDAGVASVVRDESDLPPGDPVGEYVIEDVLGRGGFGTVYRAVQPLIGKRVAIKVLSRKFSADKEMVSRFVAEARAVNQIRHRHIIDIFSFGQLPDARQYYVMEHLEGEPLDQYLTSHGPLTLDQALPILRAIARALDAAHAKGVAHRDLKPENVFIARDDEGGLFPKLLDFGIAKLNNPDEQHAHKTNTGVPIGTPYYMSPEQCRGRDVDHRCDIYSFGVLAYRVLTGTYPFGGSLVDIMHHQMYDEPEPPSKRNPGLTDSVDAAIAWMMRKDPNERPSNLISAVVALADDKTPTPAITVKGSVGKPGTAELPRSRRWVAPAIGLVVAAAAAVVIVVINSRGEPPKPPDAPVHAVITPPPPPIDATPIAVDAAVTAPAKVIVNITKVPEGTEVLAEGKVVGSAPGPVQLSKADDEVILTFKAEGYVTKSKKVTPNTNQDLAVDLARKRSGGSTRPATTDEGDDVIHVFGKEKRP